MNAKLSLLAWILCSCTSIWAQDTPIYYGQHTLTHVQQLPISTLSKQGVTEFAQQHIVHTNDDKSSPIHISGSTDPLSVLYLIRDSPKILVGIVKLIAHGFKYLFGKTKKHKHHDDTPKIATPTKLKALEQEHQPQNAKNHRIQQAQIVFKAQQEDLATYCSEQHVLALNSPNHQAWYTRTANRVNILEDTCFLQITTQTYELSEHAFTCCKAWNLDETILHELTGNTYQQLIHHELLTIVESVANRSKRATHQEALITCSVSAIAYNQAGESLHATRIADLCWMLFDYASATVEGFGLGLCTALLHAVTHPLETALYAYAGPYIVAYHMTTVLYSVLNIGFTATYDITAAQEQWDAFTKPVTDIYNALTHKELSTRDAIKTGTALATSVYAQIKLIGGLKKLCSGIAAEATSYARKNAPIKPKEYLATTDGMQQKISDPISNSPIPTPTVSNTLLLTPEKLEQALELATQENSLVHFFKKKHNFDGLLKLLGNEKNIVRAIITEANGKLPIDGFFKDIPIQVEGFTVYIRGRIVDGIPRIGTMFIK